MKRVLFLLICLVLLLTTCKQNKEPVVGALSGVIVSFDRLEQGKACYVGELSVLYVQGLEKIRKSHTFYLDSQVASCETPTEDILSWAREGVTVTLSYVEVERVSTWGAVPETYIDYYVTKVFAVRPR